MRTIRSGYNDIIQDDYFPDATGDAPQGNRLGGGAIDMSGSGAWARNDLDDMVAAPPRPASLSISNSTSTNTASTVKARVFKSQTSSGIFSRNPALIVVIVYDSETMIPS